MFDTNDNFVEKAALLESLRAGEVTVKFTKADGTQRTMCCTLKDVPSEFLPKTPESKGNTEDSPVVKVFDIEKQGWRSFRYDSILSVSL